MFHDSGNFCHRGLALKATPGATVVEDKEEKEEEGRNGEEGGGGGGGGRASCCMGKLNEYLGDGIVAEVSQNMQKEVKHIPMGYILNVRYISVKIKKREKNTKTLFRDCAPTALIRLPW